MNPAQTRSILAICLMAAFADSHKDEREREHIRRVAASLAQDGGADLIGIYQDVLLKRIDLAAAAQTLDSAELRQLAYEMAVGVCDADGVHNAEEAAFLERLRAALDLDRSAAERQLHDADELAALPLDTAPAPATPSMPTPVPSPTTAQPATGPDDAELDRMILNAAILNGALELLPQSLASMTIIPLQTRLVYRIGKAHGYELDRGHITDFLTTVGVGLTSQYLEQYGRKLVGGLLGKMLGKAGKALGSTVTGSAFSFATTYALGQVARRYYGGGRQLDTATLKATFASLLDEARSLQQRYTPQIEQRARTLDVGKLMGELRS